MRCNIKIYMHLKLYKHLIINIEFLKRTETFMKGRKEPLKREVTEYKLKKKRKKKPLHIQSHNDQQKMTTLHIPCNRSTYCRKHTPGNAVHYK